jgi:hypothetical protein
MYLAFCWLFGPLGGWVALLGQALMDMASAWFMWRSLPSRLAFPACACLLLSPYVASYSTMLLSESMALFVTTAWMAWTLRARVDWGYWCGLGALGALLPLCRSALIGVPLLGIVLVSVRSREWARGLAALGVMAMCLLPWTWRNTVELGVVTPLTAGNLGPTLYKGFTEDVATPLTTDGQGQYMAYCKQWSFRSDVPTGQVMTLCGQLRDLCVATIHAAPLAYVRSIGERAWRLWWAADDAVQNPADPESPVASGVSSVACWVQRLLVLVAMAGLLRPLSWSTMWPAMVLMGCVTVLYAPIHVEARFMLPAEPALCVLAAVAVRRSV